MRRTTRTPWAAYWIRRRPRSEHPKPAALAGVSYGYVKTRRLHAVSQRISSGQILGFRPLEALCDSVTHDCAWTYDILRARDTIS